MNIRNIRLRQQPLNLLFSLRTQQPVQHLLDSIFAGILKNNDFFLVFLHQRRLVHISHHAVLAGAFGIGQELDDSLLDILHAPEHGQLVLRQEWRQLVGQDQQGLFPGLFLRGHVADAVNVGRIPLDGVDLRQRFFRALRQGRQSDHDGYDPKDEAFHDFLR